MTPQEPAADFGAPEAGERGPVVSSRLLMASGAGMVVAAFLPWVKATAPFIGTIERSGVDGGGDGVFAIVIGAAMGFIGWRLPAAANQRRWSVLACALAVIAGAIAVVDWRDVADRIAAAESETDLVAVSEGSGLYLLAASAALGVGAALYHLVNENRSTGSSRARTVTMRRHPQAERRPPLQPPTAGS